MEFQKATIENAKDIYQLIQETVSTVYPKYYPEKIVEFFCILHNKHSIVEDIKNGYVGVLIKDNQIVGTGSYKDNLISKIYVLPSFQGRGFGSHIMDCLEQKVALTYDTARLEASLPASCMYENRGYKTVKHEVYKVDDYAIFVYDIMEKQLK